MVELKDSIHQLRNRLPELEHQLLKMERAFPRKALPQSLFGEVQGPEDCIQNILKDLEKIHAQKSSALLAYLVQRVSQKVHILVHICLSHQAPEKVSLQMKGMHTREQWRLKVEERNNKLSRQRDALNMTLETMRARNDQEAVLKLTKELTEIEKQFESVQFF